MTEKAFNTNTSLRCSCAKFHTLLMSLSVLGQLGLNETGQRSLLSSLTKLEIVCQSLAHG